MIIAALYGVEQPLIIGSSAGRIYRNFYANINHFLRTEPFLQGEAFRRLEQKFALKLLKNRKMIE
ncbi:hypothetical protein [Rhizobium sp. AC44/96]|uniref:hypothetical protein n=1 Tax=Rhizobium sp. AC44/96 TaxID=1841654 RepID=UPI0011466E1E|nr:hypothetical protein [Rhizobium sp. AC44/96]